MQRLIDTSTAFYGAGNATTRKLFKLAGGSYGGRLLAIYSQSPAVIAFSYADPPYTSWSQPVQIAADAADYPASGCMNNDGNVYVVYSKGGTLDLAFRLLSFVDGNWQVGDEVTVHSDLDNYFPSVVRQSSGKLNLCWTRYDSSSMTHELRYKTSVDNGATWGGGPTDVGSALLSGVNTCWCQLVQLGSMIYCVYTYDGDKLAYRSKDEGGALFGSESLLYSGSQLEDWLSAAVSEAGSIVGVSFKADDQLYFMEYDTETWSSPFEISENPALPPKLLFANAIPHVIYGVAVGDNQIEVRYRRKSGSGFAAAIALDGEVQPFASVLLYGTDAGTP
jgi:hypothetical protein